MRSAGAITDAPSMSSRDMRVDFARGVALLIIYVDHIQGNPIAQFMPWRVTYTSMIEVFVFLSGYVAGISFGRQIDRGGFASGVIKVARRWGQIYAAHIISGCLILALFSCWDDCIGAADVAVSSGYNLFSDDPSGFLFRFFALQERVNRFDILPLYLVLLPCIPICIALHSVRPWVLPLVSLGIYIAATITNPVISGWNWEISPFTWQLLFVTGILLGRSPQLRSFIPRAPFAVLSAVVILQALVLTKLFHPEWIPLSGRANLGPVRLLSLFCIVIVSRAIVFEWLGIASASWARPLNLCGRYSLTTYCIGVILANLANLLVIHVGKSTLLFVGVTIAGLAMCITAVWIVNLAKARLMRSNWLSRLRLAHNLAGS